MYLSSKMVPWVRRLLGGGLLTPLNKKEPELDPDKDEARPVKAEDFDVAAWTKASAHSSKKAVGRLVQPQQLAIGVAGGVEMIIISFKLMLELVVKHGGGDIVIIAIDIINAHNSYDRRKANLAVQAAARQDKDLESFATALNATTCTKPPYTCAPTKRPTDSSICVQAKQAADKATVSLEAPSRYSSTRP